MQQPRHVAALHTTTQQPGSSSKRVDGSELACRSLCIALCRATSCAACACSTHTCVSAASTAEMTACTVVSSSLLAAVMAARWALPRKASTGPATQGRDVKDAQSSASAC